MRAKVAVDGAAVYAKPDFDSEVLDYLNQGQSVPISHRQFAGTGGLGLFFKTKTPSGKLGYITDTDVEIPKDAKVTAPPGAPPRVSETKASTPKKREEEEYNDFHRPIYLTRYIGLTGGMVDYSEKFSGNKLSSLMPFVGLRMTGPLLGAPTIDFNLTMYPSAPKYLTVIGTGTASGFLVLSDIGLLFPVVESGKNLVYYGLGLMWTFSDYKVDVGGANYSSQDLRIGIDFDVGYAYRFSTFALRVDAKYYIEKTMYYGFMLSFQTEY